MSDPLEGDGFIQIRRPAPEEAPDADLLYSFSFEITQGHIRRGRLENKTPASLRPGTPLAFLKWHEAAYFLSLLEGAQHHQAAFYYHTDAFLMALHSTWDVVRSGGAGKEFESWREATWSGIVEHPRLGPIIAGGHRSLRNHALHRGLPLPPTNQHVVVMHHRDGHISSETRYKRMKLGDVDVEDPVAFFRDALDGMKKILEAAAERGYLHTIPGFEPVLVTMEHMIEQGDGFWKRGTLGEAKLARAGSGGRAGS